MGMVFRQNVVLINFYRITALDRASSPEAEYPTDRATNVQFQ